MARFFDQASSEYLETNNAVVTGAPFSVSFWFYLTSVTSGNGTIFAIVDSSVSNQFFRILFETSGDVLRFHANDGSSSVADSSLVLSASTWYHCLAIAAAVDDRTIYVDGGNTGTNTTSRTPTGLNRTSIGRNGISSPSQYFDGSVAEVGVWSAALDTSERDVLAAGYSPLFVRPQSLVSYWPLIRDEDQDRVGGYNMTAFNTPTIADHTRVFYPGIAQVISKVTAAPTEQSWIEYVSRQPRFANIRR